jgi:hypothetical protein
VRLCTRFSQGVHLLLWRPVLRAVFCLVATLLREGGLALLRLAYGA